MSYNNFYDLETLSFDAVQTFVYVDRGKLMYCHKPERFKQKVKVLKVWQALYEHCQSLKDWFYC